MTPNTCDYCGREYFPRQYNQRFCTQWCNLRYHRAVRAQIVAEWRLQQIEKAKAAEPKPPVAAE